MTIQLSKTIAIVLCVLTLGAGKSFSQRKGETLASRWALAPVVADGQLNEWPDTLSRYNDNSKIYYDIANDDKNLYLAIRSGSREALSKILMAGITISANLESNKKDPPRVVFPILDRTPGKPGARREQPSVEEMQKETIARIKDIRVFGFNDIVDGPVSLQNTYGIRAAAAFHSQSSLVQEITIPLSQLNIDPKADPVTYSIRINGLEIPSSQRAIDPRRSMGYGYGYPGQYYPVPQVNRALAPTEFSFKIKLAQQP